jgi:hypothetical protein
MARKFANFASSTLASGISDSDLTLTVASGHGSRFPSLGVGETFRLVLVNVTTTVREICQCTARSGDVLTIVRGQEGTTPTAFASGSVVSHRVTAQDFSEFVDSNDITAVDTFKFDNSTLDDDESGLFRWSAVSGVTGVLGLPGGGIELQNNLSADGSFSSKRALIRIFDNYDYNRVEPGITLVPNQGFANGGQPYGCDSDFWFQNAQNIYWISNNNKRLGAWATSTLTGDAVSAVTLQLGGRGYNTAPAVTFIPANGGPGSGATATTTITGGAVPLYYIKVTNGGSGYTSAPTVTISGGGGSGATAAAVVKGGIVTGIHLFNKGTGYTSTPGVSITGGGGSGATATAYQDRSVTGITLGLGGSGYALPPYVQIDAGGNDQLDAGPTMLICRDIANPPVNSPTGNIAFAGRLTGSLGVDAVYAGINAEILDPNPNDPRGRLGLATVSAGVFATTENTNRMYIEHGVYLGDELGYAEGTDLGKRTFNAATVAADRIYAGARAAGLPGGVFHSLSGDKAVSAGEEILRIGFKSGIYQNTSFYTADGAGWNAGAAVLKLGTVTSTGRSITAGGTIVGGGLDYAECVRKRTDCGPVAPGDVVGIDGYGEVTDQHALAHSFMIVSTAPAFVGAEIAEGDDESRYVQLSFAGQVPVNLKGSYGGEYVRAARGADGKILPAATTSGDDPHVVGKVWKVLPDGRAWVRVL